MNKKIILTVLTVVVLIAVSGIVGSEYYTSQPKFCGSCHIMKSYYKSWGKSKHGEKNIACVDCHYAPGEHITLKAKFKGLGQLFSYLSEEDKEVRKATIVSDSSCMTSACHPRETFYTQKVKFTERVPFVHKTHEDKTIEGQELHCDTCHQHVRGEKHFEVPRLACYLCHFKNTEFNKERSKCSLCHEIPTKPLQRQKEIGGKPDDNPVTHQSLEKAKVPCESCHYQLVHGRGEVIKKDCFDCHQYSSDMLKKAEDRKLMHREHVAGQNANCFDCHQPMDHKEREFLDTVRLNCSICHPDHHKYQKILLVGDKLQDVTQSPSLMYTVKTTCIGCHSDARLINGEKVFQGSAKTCVACHTDKHDDMVKDWQDKTKEELQYATEMAKEAEAAIGKAKGKMPEEKMKEVLAMFEKGKKYLRIVEYGGGVHNQKYSVKLLDIAMNNFEDLIDMLGEE